MNIRFIVRLEWSYEMYRRFNAHVMQLYISALGNYEVKIQQLRSSSINKLFHYRHAWVILCNFGYVYILEHGLYISALEHARLLILSSYVLLASLNTIHKYCHAWVI